MDVSILEDIGLTKGEIKVYLALLELGSVSAGRVLEKTSVQNSVFHFCVNRLIEKGLVSYVKKGTGKIYSAADPDNFLIYVKDKEKQIEQLLPELKAKQVVADKEEVEMYQGIKGVINLLNEQISITKKGDEFLFFSVDLKNDEEIMKFYERYQAKRRDKGLIVKGIAPKRLENVFSKWEGIEMKYTDLPLPANQGVCNDKLAIITWGDKPSGVLIKSKEIAKKQKEFFKAMWKII
ncbi:hypothetical protein HN592_02005 [Candidatus Woesearchaeota archaeon]|jgi:HTH-type transcriptional regulator, sugar sensing transcriptional regulator|nr:hypothetical protein [Candidatus Woesearchaeota archaeon]MBT4367986.1 hypothetical protein [Candidatus Woesearchaeota archaeon]MBT4712474.1 hypothetical protein [Candidatus Woesearchaeota archaeon]MBT6639387.1 hypothetical protein [Candidatus Woesearchaeota archaeon]MBT7133559.1 hypothetical protein [Candidatus Woesearchaeota archaeon]